MLPIYYRRALLSLVTVIVALILSACASTSPPLSYDGLELVPDTKFGVVYRRPGADLTGYEAYGLAPCSVAFKKDWARDQNRSSLNTGSRITQQDIEKIKATLSTECDKYFREALQTPPPYRLVETFSEGEEVLILSPAIVNLDISAPDNATSARQRSYTTQAGQMTLLLELHDATTGELLFRVIDRRRAGSTGRMQWSNSVTNQAEARRIFSRWASQLRNGLDTVTSASKTVE